MLGTFIIRNSRKLSAHTCSGYICTSIPSMSIRTLGRIISSVDWVILCMGCNNLKAGASGPSPQFHSDRIHRGCGKVREYKNSRKPFLKCDIAQRDEVITGRPMASQYCLVILEIAATLPREGYSKWLRPRLFPF